jgi:hypothetical protein
MNNVKEYLVKVYEYIKSHKKLVGFGTIGLGALGAVVGLKLIGVLLIIGGVFVLYFQYK